MKAPYQFPSAPFCLVYLASIMATFRSSNTSRLFWNVRGIRNKRVEFLTYMQINKILLEPVTERNLQPSAKLNCPNYFVYRNDRDDTPGGGTATVASKVIKHSEILLPTLQHMVATASNFLLISKLLHSILYIILQAELWRHIQLPIKTSRKEILAGDSNAEHVT